MGATKGEEPQMRGGGLWRMEAPSDTQSQLQGQVDRRAHRQSRIQGAWHTALLATDLNTRELLHRVNVQAGG